MDPDNRKEIKAQIQKSLFMGSYIGGMHNPESIQKSKLYIENLKKNDDQQIDDKTFKIMASPVKPPDVFLVYKLSARCYMEQESFFSCISKRKLYQIVLNNSKLTIRHADRICRFVDFGVVWAGVFQKSNGFVIKFEESPAQIYIEIASQNKSEQSAKWLKILSQVINSTDGKLKKFTYLATRSPLDFFKTEHVLNSQFERFANSGDIMLFKSQHSAATVQRLFTDSEYDHVGVVLRNKKNQIFIYESTSDSGVGFTSWKQFVKYEWFSQIDKMCWRQLTIKLTQSDVETIQRFIIKTLGKEFQLNLEKLFTFKSSLQRTNEQQEKKSYFCSELVSRLYKQLGILSEEKASTTYYPVDFSESGFLKIIRAGVSLSNQKLISFDKC